MALSTGSLLAGRYEISAPVAVGGMGEVWRARDRVLDRPVAAKVLKSEYTGDPNFLARFRNEARHTAALSHPNIASVYDYGETLDENGATVAYLVMEFVEGQPLVTILHEEGRMPVDWTLHVLGQAADGLSAAHRAGVIHRDIKPGNLIVRPDGVVKLTDFGIAQARDAAPLTRTGMVVGTAQYLSPEQAQGMELDATSDVYSLGVVGYECLAGVRPFDGASQVAIALAHINRPPPPLPGDVPPAVRDLIGRALAKDPAQRFADGGGFADAVRAVANGGSVPVPASSATTEVMSAVDGGTRVLDDGAARPRTGATALAAPFAGRPLPPLQGPPVDDELPDGYPADEQPRRRRALWLVAAVVVLLALAGAAWVLLHQGGRDPGTGGSPATGSASGGSQATTAMVQLDPASLIGKDVDAVTRTLQAENLDVVRQPATERQLRAAGRRLNPDAVAAVSPTDAQVPVHTQVTLYYTAEGYVPPSGAVQTGTSAPATSTSAAATTTAAPTTTTAPTTTKATSTTTATTTTAATSTSAPGTVLTTPPTEPTGTEAAGGGGNGGGGSGGGGSGGGTGAGQPVDAGGSR